MRADEFDAFDSRELIDMLEETMSGSLLSEDHCDHVDHSDSCHCHTDHHDKAGSC